METQKMSSFTISKDSFCKAAYWAQWSMCLWGNPKASIICGSCKRPFDTRRYFPFKPSGMVANCPHCGKWNHADLQWSND